MKLFEKFFTTIFPVFAVFFIDLQSKNWALKLKETLHFGLLEFKLNHNHGVIMGLFRGLPHDKLEMILLTIGSIIFATYLLTIWLLPIRSRLIYLGLSLLIGGILGNIFDRINGFGVTDFLTLNFGKTNLPYVNLADIFQILGNILIVIGVIKDSAYYWPKVDWRLKYIINFRFQIRSSLMIASFNAFGCLVALAFSYTFLKNSASQAALNTFFIFGFFITIVLTVLTFVISLVITHRVAGPLYAIQRHIQLSLLGQVKPFKLRDNDEFKEIEKILNQLNEELSSLKKTEQESKVIPISIRQDRKKVA